MPWRHSRSSYSLNRALVLLLSLSCTALISACATQSQAPSQLSVRDCPRPAPLPPELSIRPQPSGTWLKAIETLDSAALLKLSGSAPK